MTKTTSNHVASIMRELVHTEAQAAEHRTAFDEATKRNEIRRLAEAYEGRAAAMRAKLRELLTEPGVVDTPHGKVGLQPRRSLTYTPGSVRAIAPALADLVIAETVDGKALERMAKAAIKAGKLPADTLDRLEGFAEVKETMAWICQPKAPEPGDLVSDPELEEIPF